MHEFFAALISFFLIQPIQAEMEERFGNVSREAMAGVRVCIQDATPLLVQQATENPWRTATQIFGIWSGTAAPEDILAETTTSCARAVGQLRGSPDAERI